MEEDGARVGRHVRLIENRDHRLQKRLWKEDGLSAIMWDQARAHFCGFAALYTIKTQNGAVRVLLSQEFSGLEALRKRQLIDVSAGGIAVLGLSSAATLQHTADLFDSLDPRHVEVAAIELAEKASEAPVLAEDVGAELCDSFRLAKSDIVQMLADAEQIGFVDVERLDQQSKLLFNGNLFRSDTTRKIKAVLDTLKMGDQHKICQVNERLHKSACLPVDEAKKILGEELFSKLCAIGLYDTSVCSNSAEEVGYLTLPSAFSKYSSSMIDDAFDLAKAFIASITYGMTRSTYARGQIQMVDRLLSALVSGESVGPVRAIAEDYQVLELKGVVKVSQGSKKGRSGPMLTLLKREIGELASQAIRRGDVSEHSLSSLPTAIVTSFSGPETNRERVRRKQVKISPKSTNDMHSVLRAGGEI